MAGILVSQVIAHIGATFDGSKPGSKLLMIKIVKVLCIFQFFQHHCMSPRHVKRAIEEFKIKLPRRLEDKEEKKPSHEFNCQV